MRARRLCAHTWGILVPASGAVSCEPLKCAKLCKVAKPKDLLGRVRASVGVRQYWGIQLPPSAASDASPDQRNGQPFLFSYHPYFHPSFYSFMPYVSFSGFLDPVACLGRAKGR